MRFGIELKQIKTKQKTIGLNLFIKFLRRETKEASRRFPLFSPPELCIAINNFIFVSSTSVFTSAVEPLDQEMRALLERDGSKAKNIPFVTKPDELATADILQFDGG